MNCGRENSNREGRGAIRHWLALAAAIGGFVALPAAAAPGLPGALHFLDGSSLRGTLTAIDPVKGIGWRHPAAFAPADFLPRNLHTVRFNAMPAAPASTGGACRFRFANGDELTGQLLTLDATEAVIETWFAGRVRVPRAGLQSITFLGHAPAVLYQGPNHLEEWQAGPTAPLWQFRDGVLIGGGNAFIGRDMKLPARSRIEFDLASAGVMNLYLSLYTDAVERFTPMSTGYQLNLGLGYVNALRGAGQNGALHLGQAQFSVANLRQRLHFEVRTDREQATIALLVDGVPVQQWKDPGGFASEHTGVSFFTLHPGLQISGIRVSAWDGRPVESSQTPTNFTGHLVRLANHDRAPGHVESIRDGRLALDTGGSRLEVPLARVREILFQAGSPAGMADRPGEMSAQLAGGESVTLRQPRWDGRKLAGVSPHFGPVELEMRWVRMLRFNAPREPVVPDLPMFSGDPAMFFNK